MPAQCTWTGVWVPEFVSYLVKQMSQAPPRDVPTARIEGTHVVFGGLLIRSVNVPRDHLFGLRWQHPMRVSSDPPLKGLADNPAYQWWRDPTIIQPDSWWGRAHSPESLYAEADLMRELGVQLLRFDVPWRELAPTRPGGDAYDHAAAAAARWPGYRWARLDIIVEVLEAAGIAPVPVVCYAPGWAIENRGASPASPPRRAEYFADVMTALATRYEHRVLHWELWNEPDHPHSWAGTLEEYVRLVLEPGAAAVRAAAPGATILLGGLADHRNLATIQAEGGARLYDVASIHHYPSQPSVTQVRRAIQRTHARTAGGQPVWLTECGIATRPPSIPSSFGGVTNEAGQATFIQSLLATPGADAVFVYQLHDTTIRGAGGQRLKEVYWGLVSEDGSRRKPAFESFRLAPMRETSPASGPAPKRRSVLPTVR